MIVSVGARRYQVDTNLLTTLAGPVTRLVWSTLADIPQSFHVVKALCLLCTWPFPTSSTSTDPTFMLCGTMMQIAMQLGLHRPSHTQDFSKFRVELIESELRDKVRTWAVCNIVAQRCAISPFFLDFLPDFRLWFVFWVEGLHPTDLAQLDAENIVVKANKLDRSAVRISLKRPDHRTRTSEETRNTFDVDFIHHLTLPGQQSFIWGLGARVSPSSFGQTIPTLDFIPHQKTNSIYSEFVQDEIPMVRNKLSLTVGAKLEHNNYTGFEVQPSARVLWTISQQQTFWAAVTRAVRTPSRIEEDFKLTGFLLANPLIFVEIDGNRNLVPERLIGYEAGYRKLITPQLYLDFVVFHNDYDDLVSLGSATISADPTPPPPHFTIHFPWTNGIKGTTDGFEIAPDMKLTSWFQMRTSYSYLNIDLKLKPGSPDNQAVSLHEGSSPHNQVTVQSRFNLPRGFEFDQTYRYVSALPAQLVSGYSTADLHFAWAATRQMEFSIVGQNLFQPEHAEFGTAPGPLVGIKRSVYAQITWRRSAD